MSVPRPLGASPIHRQGQRRRGSQLLDPHLPVPPS